MMKQMRENTKIVLWIVVIAFVITIFAVWGLDLQTGGPSQQQNEVGRVNGTVVTPQLYQSVYNQLASKYRTSSSTGELSYTQQELLRDQAWESIVNNMLTEEQIRKMGITVTDREILSFLRTSPPPEIRQYFLDDKGEFDFAAYQKALTNPDADWTAVEQLARQRIPVIKLNQYLMAQVHVSTAELRRAFGERAMRITAEYVRFPFDPDASAGYEPSTAEIQAYYDAHLDDFSDDERRVMRFVRIPIAPSENDRGDIEYTIQHIRRELGTSEFDELARTYSEAPSSQVGGDTGYITRDQRDPRVMAAVDSLAPGEVSGPVWTDDGVYLIRLTETNDDSTATRYRLGEIFLKLSAGASTTDSLRTLAQDIKDAAANGGDFVTAAAERGLAVDTTSAFTATGPIGAMGYVPTATRFAFAHDPGALSGVLGDGENYYVCEVISVTPPGPRALARVSESISRTLVLERQKESAQREAEGFNRKLSTSKVTLSEAADQYGLTVQRVDTFTVDAGGEGLPPHSPVTIAAFDLEPGSTSQPVESFDGYYVVHVIDQSSVDEDAFAAAVDEIRSRVYQAKVQEYIAYWYKTLRENSKVEDYRGAF